MIKSGALAPLFHFPEVNRILQQKNNHFFVTSYNFNIYPLFYFTFRIYYNIKRFKLFHFSSPLYLVAKSAGGAADFCFFHNKTPEQDVPGFLIKTWA